MCRGGSSVRGMTFSTLLESHTRTVLADLAGFDREAALAAGLAPATVTAWGKVHHTYYGPTTSRKKQRVARETAIECNVSLDKLILIENKIAEFIKIHKARADKASSDTLTPAQLTAKCWELRIELLSTRGRYETLKRAADALIPKEKVAPKDNCVFSRPANGKQTMKLTGGDRFMADLKHRLSQKLDSDKPIGPQMFEAFETLVRDGGSVPESVPRPLILIPLPAWVDIANGDGDETVLGLTDGTTIMGKEFLEKYFAKPECGLEAATFHPREGAVNLYDVERLANAKQADLARASMPVCPVPDCRHDADSCEIHHIVAWKHGGPTNIANLAPLCRYHNRTNDDDVFYPPGSKGTHSSKSPPGSAHSKKPKRGHIINNRGTPIWCSPRGYLVPNDHANHKFAAMLQLFGASSSAS